MPPSSEAECVSRLGELLSAEQAVAREQLSAALGEALDQVLEQRFAAIARQVGAELEAMLERARAAPAQDWAELPLDEQRLHLEAQRFARVKAAEIRLYQGEAVERGRARADVYGELRALIDTARQTFRQDYVAACPSMKDYLHLELVRVLAQDNAALLGPDYPGPLV